VDGCWGDHRRGSDHRSSRRAVFVFRLEGLSLGDVPQINSPQFFSVDPLNIFIPTELTRVGGTLFARLVQRFHLFEHGGFDAYLGFPLVLILILQLRNIRQRPCLKPLYISLLVMIVLSMRPTLRVAGVDTNVWLPWSLSLHLPLIHQALPFRFSMYVGNGRSAGCGVVAFCSQTRMGPSRAFYARSAGLRLARAKPDGVPMDASAFGAVFRT